MNKLVLILMFAAGVFAQERYVNPVDEAKLDLSFLAFRTKLIAAAERKDVNFIYSILDPKIQLSFGGDSGIPRFKKMWNIQSKDTKFWREFLPVINNGGSFDRADGKRTNVFFAPYTLNSFPDDLDGFEYSVIFGSDVNLRKEPKMNSEIVARLSYNIVKVDPDVAVLDPVPDPKEQIYTGRPPEVFFWKKVTTLGGLTGFVKEDFVRSPVDYRAGFEKKRGVWKMVAFIEGD